MGRGSTWLKTGAIASLEAARAEFVLYAGSMTRLLVSAIARAVALGSDLAFSMFNGQERGCAAPESTTLGSGSFVTGGWGPYGERYTGVAKYEDSIRKGWSRPVC